jgi:hypothetical protein
MLEIKKLAKEKTLMAGKQSLGALVCSMAIFCPLGTPLHTGARLLTASSVPSEGTPRTLRTEEEFSLYALLCFS